MFYVTFDRCPVWTLMIIDEQSGMCLDIRLGVQPPLQVSNPDSVIAMLMKECLCNCD
jgi:hypothetical protein